MKDKYEPSEKSTFQMTTPTIDESSFQIDKQQFGIFISNLRKEKGFTQKELAQKLFVSDKAVSKWERGLSMPDISLLVPLSEVLEVSVTELLKHQRMTYTDKMDTGQVDEIVKKAIHISKERLAPNLPSKKTWCFIYVAAIVILLIELATLSLNPINGNHIWMFLPENLLVGIGLGLILGIFSLMTQTKLPDYYDQNTIYGHTHGFFRIQIPGVAFNNRNYPYILFTMRVWSVGMITIFPLVYSILSHILGTSWVLVDEIVTLVLIMVPLFVPLYIVGKKYK